MKIFILDDNKDVANQLGQDLQNTTHEVVGVAYSGEDIVDKIVTAAPEILLIDAIIPHLDGLGVISKLNELSKASDLFNMPITIMMSTISTDSFVTNVTNRGIDFFIAKPFTISTVLSAINIFDGNYMAQKRATALSEVAVATLGDNPNISFGEFDTETIVSELLKKMGMPAHIKGYTYSRDAILLTLENPEIISAVTKELYPSIAKKHNTTSSRVERAIRHSVEVGWSRGNTDMQNETFGFTVNSTKGKPTNSEFIASVAERIRILLRAS